MRTADQNTAGTFHEEEMTAGKFLHTERIKRNILLEEVSRATGILLAVLDALEKDDRRQLPADVFVRGFIKLYADYLGLDHHLVPNLYHHGQDNYLDHAQEMFSRGRLAESALFFTWRKALASSILVLSVFFGYLIYQSYPLLIKKIESFQASKGKSPQERLLEKGLPAGSIQNLKKEDMPLGQATGLLKIPAESTPQQEKVETLPALGSDAPGDRSAVMQNSTSAAIRLGEQGESNQTTTIKGQITPLTSPREEEGSVYLLKAVFRDSTWMRVQIDDQNTVQGLFQPESTHQWKSQKGFHVTLGNAGGVDLYLNDSPVHQNGKPGQVLKLVLP